MGADVAKIGILTSHPIQYQSPIFRQLASISDLDVFFAHEQSPQDQADAGFNVRFNWDIDLLDGYRSRYLDNISRNPSVSRFAGCDTPEIKNIIRENGFDGFIVTGWNLKSFWQAITACRRAGVPVLVRGDSRHTRRTPVYKRIVKSVVYPWLLNQLDACLYVGKSNREYLQSYGVPENRLYFSPHCVDNIRFSEQSMKYKDSVYETRKAMGISEHAYVCLFVGKFIDIKRPIDLVRAAEKLITSGMQITCIFAGSGPLEASIREESRKLGVPAVFPGFVNTGSIAKYYSLADVLVLPSASETWGLVVNEAMACGVPVVVSSEVGCAPDLVRPGETGMVYSVGDTDEMATSIKTVLDLNVYHSLKSDLKRVIDEYSPENAARGMLDAVNTLKTSRK